MLGPIGQGPEPEGLHAGDRLGRGGGICEDARQVGYLGDPAALDFSFDLDLEEYRRNPASEG